MMTILKKAFQKEALGNIEKKRLYIIIMPKTLCYWDTM